MPSRCVFMYDHPDSVYYSGQVLNGKIVLTTDKVKTVRGIYITIKGVAKVRWTESKSRHNHQTNKTENYTVEYRGDRQYLHSQTMVEGQQELPPGTHEYTFTTPLPVQIPSSISGEYGHISYEVELKLDRPMRFDNVYSNFFTVISPLDLNLSPQYLDGIVDEETKYFCCLFCESGPVKSELETQFSGYAPGQEIEFTVTVDNESNRDIEGCTVALVQKISFQSESPEHKTKTVKHVVKSLVLDGTIRLSKTAQKGTISVPPLPPSSAVSSDIISVYYYLRAEIETGMCSNNEVLHCGITIGTVPLYASARNPENVITVQPTAPTPTDDIDGDKPPQYTSVVPPSFEEATGMNKPFVDRDMNEHQKYDPYIPKYPVYNNFSIPSAPGETPQAKETQPSWVPPPTFSTVFNPSATPDSNQEVTLPILQTSVNPSEAGAFPKDSNPEATISLQPPSSSVNSSKQGLPNKEPVTTQPQPSSLPYPAQGFGFMPSPENPTISNQSDSGVGWKL